MNPMSKDLQTPFDVAVVIQTILRPSLARAVRSVFRQDIAGRVQLLIGIDKREGGAEMLDELVRDCPGNMCLTIIDLGYSTSRRHGGVYPNGYGGGLRTILSYSANSRFVAYLDDDDWWAHDHLSSLLSAVSGKGWAFSYRWMVDRETGWPICRDEWDSVGPHRGINKERFGGFVAPSNLILDKEICHFILPYWAAAAFPDGTGEDRLVFKALLNSYPWAASQKYSSYYEIRREEQQHVHHAREFATRKIDWLQDRRLIDTIVGLSDAAASALENGRPEEAITAGRQALALNPYHARSLYCLAMAQWQLGRESDAMAHITRARAADNMDLAIARAWTQIAGSSLSHMPCPDALVPAA